MTQFITIILVAAVSLLSQLNLKSVSNRIFVGSNITFPTNPGQLILLLLQIVIPSALSLSLTIFGYSKFSFYQFLIYQTLYFIFAGTAEIVIFHGQITWRFLASSAFILSGILVATKR